MQGLRSLECWTSFSLIQLFVNEHQDLTWAPQYLANQTKPNIVFCKNILWQWMSVFFACSPPCCPWTTTSTSTSTGLIPCGPWSRRPSSFFEKKVMRIFKKYHFPPQAYFFSGGARVLGWKGKIIGFKCLSKKQTSSPVPGWLSNPSFPWPFAALRSSNVIKKN